MITDRQYLTLPVDYLEELEAYSDEEVGKMVRALFRYVLFGEETTFTGDERFFFKRMLNQEIRARAKYEEKRKQRSLAGQKGANARWHSDEAKAEEAEAFPAPDKAEACPSLETKPVSPPELPEKEIKSAEENTSLQKSYSGDKQQANPPLLWYSAADLVPKGTPIPPETREQRLMSIEKLKKLGFVDADLEDYLVKSAQKLPSETA